MDITEKFLKIVGKAESNGFSFRNDSDIDNIDYIGMGRFKMDMTIKHKQEDGEVEEKTTFTFNITEVFFNHNFAKTFFGDREVCGSCGHNLSRQNFINGDCSNCDVRQVDVEPVESWKRHLQEMVLEEDIMEYLIKHVG